MDNIENMSQDELRRVGYCPSCHGNLREHISGRTDYQELYLTILQIGQSKVNHGMTYNDLINELGFRGFNINNGCLKQAVKHWFYDAYFHITSKGEKCTLDELEDHSECTFILKGESSLLLLEHDKINKTIRLAWMAILTAIAIGILSMIASWYIANHTTVNSETKDAQQTIATPPESRISTPINR